MCPARRLFVAHRLLDVFVSHQGNPYLVFELLEMDLKQYMDQSRGKPLDLVKCKVRALLRRQRCPRCMTTVKHFVRTRKVASRANCRVTAGSGEG